MPPRTHGQHPVSQVDPIGQMAKFWNPTPHGRRRHHTVIGTYLHGPVPGPQPALVDRLLTLALGLPPDPARPFRQAALRRTYLTAKRLRSPS